MGAMSSRISTSSWSVEKARSTLFLALYSCDLLYEKTPTIMTPPAPQEQGFRGMKLPETIVGAPAAAAAIAAAGVAP